MTNEQYDKLLQLVKQAIHRSDEYCTAQYYGAIVMAVVENAERACQAAHKANKELLQAVKELAPSPPTEVQP